MRSTLLLLAVLCGTAPALAASLKKSARTTTTARPAPRTSSPSPVTRRPAQAPPLTPAPIPQTTPVSATSPGTAHPPAPPAIGATFPTAVYGELIQFEYPPTDVIQWDADSSRQILQTATGPVLHLKGRLATGYEMMFDDQWVPLHDNRFDITLLLASVPRLVDLRIFDPDRHFRIYPLVFFWNRALPGINQPIPTTRRTGFAQLYSGETPAMVVDLDATREAALSFRLYLPPGTDTACERWDLIIENMAGREVAHLYRKGYPPPFVDWRVMRDRIQAPGEYHYRLQMTYGGQKYEGFPSRFHAFAGSHVFEHAYASSYKFEPRQELGYFTFSNPGGVTYKAAYLGADLGLALKERFLARISGMTELPGSDPNGVMTFLRFAAGLRLAGYKPNTNLGNPFLFQIDALVGYSNFLLGKPPFTSHFGSPSGLVEAKFILRSRHRLVPWAELGMSGGFLRFSGGLNYSYYLRRWGLAFGVGVAYDQLAKYDASPNLRFTLMRTMTSMTFFL